EQWATLSIGERREFSWLAWQAFIAHVKGAMFEDTFEARSDRMLAWRPVDLDEQGWREMTASVNACFANVEQIKREADARMAESGEEAMRATWGIFTFESPARR